MANSIQKQVINVCAHVILGTHVWDTVLELIALAGGNTQLTGQEKHDKVVEDLQHIFKDVGLSLLNLAIELGVTYLGVANPAVGAVVAPLAGIAEKSIQKEVDKDTAPKV